MERYHVTKTGFRLYLLILLWMCLSDSAHQNESIHVEFLHFRLIYKKIIEQIDGARVSKTRTKVGPNQM